MVFSEIDPVATFPHPEPILVCRAIGVLFNAKLKLHLPANFIPTEPVVGKVHVALNSPTN